MVRWFSKLFAKNGRPLLTSYEKVVIAFLFFLEATVIIDFIVIAPLGVMIIEDLKINARQFGEIVAIYAFCGALSAFLSAGLADRYDRKKLLLVFYVGFLLGTGFCALAFDYVSLLLARGFTGVFGGVVGSISFAIITDVFVFEKRGFAMGWIQSSFAASQILGIPFGLFIAGLFNWHAIFWAIVLAGSVVGVLIYFYLRPVKEHLLEPGEKSFFKKTLQTLFHWDYVMAYGILSMLMVMGFVVFPFTSTFVVENLGLKFGDLTIIYIVSGVASLFFSPFVGRLTDKFGTYQVFFVASFAAIGSVLWLTGLEGPQTLVWVAWINTLFIISWTAQFVAIQTLVSAVPKANDRGSFMNLLGALQMVAGGVASVLAGRIVYIGADGKIENFFLLGVVTASISVVGVFATYKIYRQVVASGALKPSQPEPPAPE